MQQFESPLLGCSTEALDDALLDSLLAFETPMVHAGPEARFV